MALLFVNACMREGSRTERLARAWLDRRGCDFEEVRLAEDCVDAFDAESIKVYQASVASGDFSHPMFEPAKKLACAEEIAIAAPLWNFALPAKLHDYLELVCSQGITFDIDAAGGYVSLTHARRLVFVSTSGGLWPKAEDDHAFGYLETLCRLFWHVSRVEKVVAEGLDANGCDVDQALAAAIGNSL
jgi:FMN-dependent NADH-azoreductase